MTDTRSTETDLDSVYEPFAVAHALGHPLDAPPGSRIYTVTVDGESGLLLDGITCTLKDAEQAVIHYIQASLNMYLTAVTLPCPTCHGRGYWNYESGKKGTPYRCKNGHTWMPQEIAHPELITYETAKNLLESTGLYVTIHAHILGSGNLS